MECHDIFQARKLWKYKIQAKAERKNGFENLVTRNISKPFLNHKPEIYGPVFTPWKKNRTKDHR